MNKSKRKKASEVAIRTLHRFSGFRYFGTVVEKFVAVSFAMLPVQGQRILFVKLMATGWWRHINTEQRRAYLARLKQDCSPELFDPLVIGFIPPVYAAGWILGRLFRDIQRFACNARFILVHDMESVAQCLLSSRSCIVFALHQTYVKNLVEAGVDKNLITTYYTHTRLSGNGEISELNSIAGVFPQNSTEAKLLYMNGINPEKITVFPAGISLETYSKNVQDVPESRDIDVLYVGQYRGPGDKYYYVRKNHDFLIRLAKHLSSTGLRVAFLGTGWSVCADGELAERVSIYDIPYSEYASVYHRSKLSIFPSLQEGGPVSWLEAMASGCICLSYPTGFPLELQSGHLGSHLMGWGSTCEGWCNRIQKLLDCEHPIDSSLIAQRFEFLRAADFASLCSVLETAARYGVSSTSRIDWPVRTLSVQENEN